MIVATSAVNHSDLEIGKTGGSTRTPRRCAWWNTLSLGLLWLYRRSWATKSIACQRTYFWLGPQDQCHCCNGYRGQTLTWSNGHMSSSKILLPSTSPTWSTNDGVRIFETKRGLLTFLIWTQCMTPSLVSSNGIPTTNPTIQRTCWRLSSWMWCLTCARTTWSRYAFASRLMAIVLNHLFLFF